MAALLQTHSDLIAIFYGMLIVALEFQLNRGQPSLRSISRCLRRSPQPGEQHWLRRFAVSRDP